MTINRQTAQFHDLTVNYGSGLIVNFIAAIYGNTYRNDGSLAVVQTTNQHPLFRSYSKNLIISGVGTIKLDNGDLGGNMSFGAGQTVSGAGTIGGEADRLFNDGAIQADLPGKEIAFLQAINGTGTFVSQNGAGLRFTSESSADYLTNNGRVQIDGDFTVARDYQGSYFYTGNNFDARRTVAGTGQILAADARQVVSGPRLSGNVIDFGAMRVGGKASTSLTVANTGGLTTLRGAVQSRNAPNVVVTNANFVLGSGGATSTAGLTFSGTTSGSVSGQTIDVVNNFDNVSDDHLSVHANVYAPAVVYLPSTTVNFGTVRKGTTGNTASVTIGNAATGALSDVLVASFGATPGGITYSAPLVYLPGTTSTATYQLYAFAPGYVGGSTTIGFTSHDAELADLSLGSKTLYFNGTVTDPAVAALAKASGAGSFGGGGGVYTLDLGRLNRGSGIFGTDIAVLNTVFGSYFAETLGGGFSLTGDAGYSFAGEAFSGLAGGGRDIGNWLGFDTSRLANGIYRGVLTFNGFSRYAGLNDLALGPIRVDVSAQVVPEPASWALMIAGFGTVGLGLRRRRGVATA